MFLLYHPRPAAIRSFFHRHQPWRVLLILTSKLWNYMKSRVAIVFAVCSVGGYNFGICMEWRTIIAYREDSPFHLMDQSGTKNTGHEAIEALPLLIGGGIFCIIMMRLFCWNEKRIRLFPEVEIYNLRKFCPGNARVLGFCLYLKNLLLYCMSAFNQFRRRAFCLRFQIEALIDLILESNNLPSMKEQTHYYCYHL